jgi:hypothetical protein
MKNLRSSLFLLIFLISAAGLFSQEADTRVPVPYGPAEFPEWQKDVRRAEILSFGALPFITFMASIYYDVYRYIDHDGDEGYLPWPLKKSDSAVPLTEDEQKTVLLASAGISVGVALFDFGFRSLMRSIRAGREEKRNREAPEPILIEPVQETENEIGGEE